MILFHLFALTQIFQRISFPTLPAQTESDILSAMFSNSTDIVEQSKDLISLFVNTESAAGFVTCYAADTGILTPSGASSNYLNYPHSSNGKLALSFRTCAAISNKFTTLNGHTECSADDFTDSSGMNYCAETPDDPNPKTGYRKELFQKTIGIVTNTDF